MTNDKVVQILRDHCGSWFDAGDGYTEPRESWVDCTECDVTLWSWQQYYDENEEEPEDVIREHQAEMLRVAELLVEAE